MSHRILRIAFLLALCLTIVSPGQAAPPEKKRSITEKDLFDFVWIGNPQLSPDGAQVVFTRVVVDAKKTGYDTSLWLVPADASAAPRQLTRGPHDGGALWSPDGKTLVFTRAEEKDGKPQPPQLALLSLAAGMPSSSPICRKARAIRAGRRMGNSSSSPAVPIRKISRNGRRKRRTPRPARMSTRATCM